MRAKLPDIGEFAEFADGLRGYRERNADLARSALRHVGDRYPGAAEADLTAASHALEVTLHELDRAAEELRIQNEALVAARVELEETSSFFRDLFELAPTPYLVTSVETRITYANSAACALFGRAKNALVGKPLACFVPVELRTRFRDAVATSSSEANVTSWLAVLAPSGVSINCRMRVRVATTPGLAATRVLFWNITEETDEDLF
jgi:PAS domain S-box-containing protein